ncbi:MAG TPA: FAD-dependent oxidoreductase [Candidatus Micrarchaeaceae archaeon]|nr:FAD-dependent oxidoreductase [Candidatus Micrarchaeaceae archaeon]
MTTQLLTHEEKSPGTQPEEHAFVHVDSERCVGCQECVIRCPTEALRLDAENWIAQADDRLCVGCRQCQRVCPFSAITVTGPVVVGPRQAPATVHPRALLGNIREVRRGFSSWREAVAEAERCLNCPDPTCLEGCPAHNDIPGFVAAVRLRDLDEAHAILRKTSVLPDICSRVCDQSVQCEGACSWALAGGQPVGIGQLERFITERAAVPAVERTSAEGVGLSVAVVGSGPAGCAAAWWLLAAGANVSMLEKGSSPGGVLRWGIPDFTLPTEIAERPIEALVAAGMDLQTGTTLGEDVSLETLLARHDAVILAHGASRPIVPPIPGVELLGTEDATVFLDRAKRALLAGELLPEIGPGARVLVIGGGNTAMDVARTVCRLGAEAIAIEWMDERFTRVRPDELAEARREGVEVRFSHTVQRLEGDSIGVSAAWLQRTRQRRVGDRPKVLPGTPEKLAINRVVFALGYRVSADVAAGMVELPLPPVDLRQAIPGRRWLASGILSGESTVGAEALAREVTLAVAGTPTKSGWSARLLRRRRTRPTMFRTGWWTWLWRRQAAIGLDAAQSPLADRLWVAGDALVGPSTVVGAMAQGREAAQAVLRTYRRRLEVSS